MSESNIRESGEKHNVEAIREQVTRNARALAERDLTYEDAVDMCRSIFESLEGQRNANSGQTPK